MKDAACHKYMTLIAIYNSDGCVGRCDAKCYNASEPGCDCICGGMNHGAGKAQAIANTREQLIDRLKAQGELEIAKEVAQLELF